MKYKLKNLVGRTGIEPVLFTLWVSDLQSDAFANYAYPPVIKINPY